MHDEERQRGPTREITKDQVPLACAVFLAAHPGCGETVELTMLKSTLICWCERCNDLHTFPVVNR